LPAFVSCADDFDDSPFAVVELSLPDLGLDAVSSAFETLLFLNTE